MPNQRTRAGINVGQSAEPLDGYRFNGRGICYEPFRMHWERGAS